MIYLDPWRQGSILSIYSHIHINMPTDTMFGLPSDPYSEYGYGASTVCLLNKTPLIHCLFS